jgi:uncharacterized protein YyaL (SSP411 family)
MPATNRLANETSPYLKQHAHNPVDWYPWGPEALQRARELDRPIFLSIGYSACHWCHVMEHESFEDPKIGQLLNDHFVSIKVDREERPDLDQIYMTAVQILTHHGGWPMSVFLTPELKPFFGGTYFPPEDRYGQRSFSSVLHAVIEAWQTRRDAVADTAEQLTQTIHQAMRVEPRAGDLDDHLLRNAASQLRRRFDSQFGGFGGAPKFPHPMDLRLLLRVWKRFGDEDALAMVNKTLDCMARGGIYDHLGGGFHRYSTDQRWLVPHFEKMLYDNALLTFAYVEAFQATGNPLYREVIEETMEYVMAEMSAEQGGFFSTQDADSEGEEGKFFVWTKAEIDELLGPDVSKVFCAVYDVTPEGNWEGKNILNRARGYDVEAKMLGISEAELRKTLLQAKAKLLEVRGQRVWPGRDEKILASWNGLMMTAFARAGQALGKSDYIGRGLAALDFIANQMRTREGRLLRLAGGTLPGYLEDYAFVLEGMIALYEASWMGPGLAMALKLADTMIEQFWDESEGGFFYTGRDHETLITRTKDQHDSSIPSGNAVAATALLRLAALTDRQDLRDKAVRTLQLFRGLMESSPMAAGQMLVALDFHLGPVEEIVLVGDPRAVEAKQVLAALHGKFRPHHVLATRVTTDEPGWDKSIEDKLPLLKDKTALGPVTTYICGGGTCQAPLTDAASAVEALKMASGGR